jgi:hypothetical protein
MLLAGSLMADFAIRQSNPQSTIRNSHPQSSILNPQ